MKKSLSLIGLLAAGLILTGCNKNTSSNPNPSSSDSSSIPPSTSVIPPSSSDTLPPSTDIVDNVLPEGTLLREYDSEFDSMLDPMTGESPVGTVAGDAKFVSRESLKVIADSRYVDFDYPSTPDAAAYKYAKKSDINAAHGIGFRIRLASGTLPLDKVFLGLRGADDLKVYPISLATAANVDGDAVPALTEEYQDLVICPTQSIEDENAVYQNADGTPSQVKVLSKIIGFHLFVAEGVEAQLEIEEVFIDKAGTTEILDVFNRENVMTPDDNCWWRGSAGYIDIKHVALTSGSYQLNVAANSYEKLVLRIKGDVSGLSLATSKSQAIKTKTWSELKSGEGQALPALIPTFKYNNIVIDLASSGLDVGLEQLIITSTTPIDLAGVFLTNMEVKQAVETYPLLDTASATIFDDFNRTQNKIVFNDYDQAAASVADYGLNFAITYNSATQDRMNVDGNALVFDNVAASGEGAYAQYKSGSKRSANGYKYMVLSVKGEEGATLDTLRIGGSLGNPIYASSWVSAQGLSVPSLDATDYPYTTADGYKWLIVDLALTGYTDVTDILDIYYSGAGKLSIDTIFFANDYLGTPTENPESFTNSDLGGYAYMTGIDAKAGTDYYSFVIESIDEGASLNSFRLAAAGAEKWVKDGALILQDGSTMSGSGWKVGDKVVIDLVKSGIVLESAEAIHLHTGGDADSAGKAITISHCTAYVIGDYNYDSSLGALPVLDYIAPTIVITEPDGTVAPGDYEVTYTVSDNLTAEVDIEVTISAKKISGDAGSGSGAETPIIIVGNILKDLTTGTYEIAVTATDQAGNISTEKVQITVA